MVAELTPRQHQAIKALLVATDQRAAAKACGVGERSLYRWLSDPVFRSAYRAASRRSSDDAAGRLRAATGQAVAVLVEALGDNVPTIRLRAATAILDTVLRFDQADVNDRLTALEAVVSRAN